MAKRRGLSTEKKITQTKEAIAVKEEEIKELKAQMKELMAQKKKEDLEELYQILTESGKSIEEVKDMLTK